MVWALYATEQMALDAMNTQRFGAAPWSVDFRPSVSSSYPWVLIDNGWKDERCTP